MQLTPAEAFVLVRTAAAQLRDVGVGVVLPSSLSGGLASRLGLAITAELPERSRGFTTKVASFNQGLRDALPFSLFVAFCFCASISSGLFAAWSCEEIELANPTGADATTKSFLRADYRIECSSDDSEYAFIVTVATVFVAIWSFGVPISFVLVLLPHRSAIMARKETRETRATPRSCS